MSVLVWVQGWQMQCCGDPFAVGDEVNWILDADPDTDWLEAALGTELASGIAYAEDHHGGLPDETPVTRSRVLAIKTAHGRYAAQPPDGKTLYPVPGTAVLRGVHRVDGSEPDLPDMPLNGYLVEVDPLTPRAYPLSAHRQMRALNAASADERASTNKPARLPECLTRGSRWRRCASLMVTNAWRQPTTWSVSC